MHARSTALLIVAAAACRNADEQPAPVVILPPPEAPPAPDCDPKKGPTCFFNAVRECKADGTFGARLEECKDRCVVNACVDRCTAKGVDLIYVFDDHNNLRSFDPKKLPGNPFKLIGRLTCDTSQPFSMAVDHGGTAWVLYGDGMLYPVSIVDAKCGTGLAAARGEPDTFGMGFVADGADETLYTAPEDMRLGKLEVGKATRKWTRIGRLATDQTHFPELTGADGKLFGYFADADAGFVQEIDRATAKLIGPKRVATHGYVGGFAMAHWGGVFYVFATVDSRSSVFAVKRGSGATTTAWQDLPYEIVGAGVSTCAPQLERPEPQSP